MHMHRICVHSVTGWFCPGPFFCPSDSKPRYYIIDIWGLTHIMTPVTNLCGWSFCSLLLFLVLFLYLLSHPNIPNWLQIKKNTVFPDWISPTQSPPDQQRPEQQMLKLLQSGWRLSQCCVKVRSERWHSHIRPVFIYRKMSLLLWEEEKSIEMRPVGDFKGCCRLDLCQLAASPALAIYLSGLCKRECRRLHVSGWERQIEGERESVGGRSD